MTKSTETNQLNLALPITEYPQHTIRKLQLQDGASPHYAGSVPKFLKLINSQC